MTKQQTFTLVPKDEGDDPATLAIIDENNWAMGVENGVAVTIDGVRTKVQSYGVEHVAGFGGILTLKFYWTATSVSEVVEPELPLEWETKGEVPVVTGKEVFILWKDSAEELEDLVSESATDDDEEWYAIDVHPDDFFPESPEFLEGTDAYLDAPVGTQVQNAYGLPIQKTENGDWVQGYSNYPAGLLEDRREVVRWGDGS